MSIREIINKATLRAFVIVGSFTILWSIILFIIVKSSVNISVTGTIDLSMLFGAFVSIISFALGYLFGKEVAR